MEIFANIVNIFITGAILYKTHGFIKRQLSIVVGFAYICNLTKTNSSMCSFYEIHDIYAFHAIWRCFILFPLVEHLFDSCQFASTP